MGLRGDTTKTGAGTAGKVDAKWCRAQAQECEDLARLVSLRTDKDQLAEKARKWRDMADQAEERSHDDAGSAEKSREARNVGTEAYAGS